MENRVAVFIDFENIALAVREHIEYERVNLQGILEQISRTTEGRIVVKRAYADWGIYKDYRSDLLNNATDPIQVFALTSRGKNGADIKIAIDVMDVVLSQKDITHVALVSGDSDFTPLVLKLRESGRYVHGLGVKATTSSYLVKSCDFFSFYGDLRGEEGESLSPVSVAAYEESEGLPLTNGMATPLDPVALLARAMALLGNRPIPGSALKTQMRKLDAAFHETRHGYASFLDFLRASNEVVDVYKPAIGDITVAPKGQLEADGVNASEVAARAAEQRQSERTFHHPSYTPYESSVAGNYYNTANMTIAEKYHIYLRDTNFRFVPTDDRQQIMRVMYDIFGETREEGISLKEAKDRLHHWFEENRPAVPWESVNSTVYHLFYTWCFSFDRTDGDDGKALWDRRTSLHSEIKCADDLIAKFEKGVIRKIWERDRAEVDVEAINAWLFDGVEEKREYVGELVKNVTSTATMMNYGFGQRSY